MAEPSTKRFPYKSTFIKDADIQLAFAKLSHVQINLTVSNTLFMPPMFGIPDDWYTFKMNKLSTKPSKASKAPKASETYIAFYDESDSYDTMDFVTDIFTEKQRLAASKNGHTSILEQWKRKSFRDSIYTQAMKLYNSVDARSLRETIYQTQKASECTQFKASLTARFIKWIYHLNPTDNFSVLDPSAGWGDRLIGAMACILEVPISYTAYDPNTTLRNGHTNIIKSFNEYLLSNNAKPHSCKIHYQGYETMTPQQIPDNSIDLVFTSPPFFDFEIYTTSTDPNQSTTQHPTFNDWFVNFLIKIVIQKSIRTLKPGGFLAIHISDVNKLKICDPMILFVTTLFKDLTYYGPVFTIGYSKRKEDQRPRPIWVFRKEPNTNSDSGTAVLKNKYPALFKLYNS